VRRIPTLGAAVLFACCVRADVERVDGVDWTFRVTGGAASVEKGLDPSVSGALTVPPVLGGAPVTAVADYAFAGKKRLVRVTLPDGVKTLGEGVFEGCDLLEGVKLPEGLALIPDGAFFGCRSLKDVRIPSSVRQVGLFAFCGCAALEGTAGLDPRAEVSFGAFLDCGAAEKPDPRTRAFVRPVRVVSTHGDVRGVELLLAPRFGQIPEGRFLDGSGCVLKGAGAGIVLDFGRELHGGLQIGSGGRTASAGAKARVRFGESVAEALSEPGVKGACNDHAIRDSAIDLPWAGTREIGQTGFRFVRIDIVGEGPLALDSVRAVSLQRPMRERGTFRCSDERVNRIRETAVRTVHLCCQDLLWDGIKRDRLVWMGDTHPETMALLAAFGPDESSVLPESLAYMAAVTPPDAWMNGMPAYTLWWIRNVYEWWFATGDASFARRHADYLRATIAQCARFVSKDGRCTMSGFLDWPTQHDPAAVKAGMQALMAKTFDDAAAVAADALGDAALAADCRARAAALRTVRPEPHGSKQAAALLALHGLRDPKEMFAQTLGKDGVKGFSTFYGYYMLEAMSEAGETGRALDAMRDYWGAMLDMGATSFWEDFDVAWTNGAFRIDEMPVAGKKDVHGDYGDFCYRGFRHSLCHGWAGGPAAWLTHRVLGIEPRAPGCTKVAIRPDLGSLAWAEGTYPTPRGEIEVRHERAPDGTVRTTRLVLPPGTERVAD